MSVEDGFGADGRGERGVDDLDLAARGALGFARERAVAQVERVSPVTSWPPGIVATIAPGETSEVRTTNPSSTFASGSVGVGRLGAGVGAGAAPDGVVGGVGAGAVEAALLSCSNQEVIANPPMAPTSTRAMITIVRRVWSGGTGGAGHLRQPAERCG
jgi:hypothetical protein